MSKRRPINSNSKQMLQLFKTDFKELVEIATHCHSLDMFKYELQLYVAECVSDDISHRPSISQSQRFWNELLQHEGETIAELSTEQPMTIDTLSNFWLFLNGALTADLDTYLWVERDKRVERLQGTAAE